MKPQPQTIWCNYAFDEHTRERFLAQVTQAGAVPHRVIFAARDRSPNASVLTVAAPDPTLREATIALGQPDPATCLDGGRLRWIALTSAGYTRYDTPAFMDALKDAGIALTNASSVFAEPCAQHLLAMMLTLGRQLLPARDEQLGNRTWRFMELRRRCVLLNGQTVVLLGYGAIARRLVELLAPFDMKIYAVRRRAYSERGVHVIADDKITAVLLAEADHVINVLPDNAATLNYVNARRLSAVKPGAHFYNIGRGTTVDNRALQEALESGRLGAAYLDVFEQEPLPPSHPLWTAPNCYITPHAAGGRRDQDEAIAAHFVQNLRLFESGATTPPPPPLRDRVV
ncbi:D-2-hydroxyacid dehydrogenase [Opitutaceae bacterium TAV3]|nr:D-2-hydroxyacid dehydrogenase [Opitutaceae bacterium TAV3]